ncbi:Inner membrane protein YjdF [Hydrogenophaga sp. T4]|nr:Inner membrane protein YjdF [Hydrogenophaga sp. T4]
MHETSLGPRGLLIYSLVLLALLALSGFHPLELDTWALEVAPVIISLPLLWFSWQRFPLTRLVYALIFVHALVLMLGGHYTYAKVPLVSGCRTSWAWRETPTTASATWPRALCPPWWRVSCCCA